jgi:hypothetical protein
VGEASDELHPALDFNGVPTDRCSRNYSFGESEKIPNRPLGGHDVLDASQSHVGRLHQTSPMADSFDANTSGRLPDFLYFETTGEWLDRIAR